MALPANLRRALGAVWRFPAKGLAVLLLAVVLFEGDAPRGEYLPAAFATMVIIALWLLLYDRGMPAKVCAALVIISLLARENYPLSHYPMYDRFTDHTFYVYVADGDGEPLPVQTLTGKRTSRIKKPYDKALDKVRKALGKRKRELTPAESEEAGLAALRDLYEFAGTDGQQKLEQSAPIRLYQVDIFARDGEIDKRPPELIAELELPGR